MRTVQNIVVGDASGKVDNTTHRSAWARKQRSDQVPGSRRCGVRTRVAERTRAVAASQVAQLELKTGASARDRTEQRFRVAETLVDQPL